MGETSPAIFGVMGTRAYHNMAIALVVAVAIEVPAVHLIVGVGMEAGWARGIAQAVLALSSASLVVWLWRDFKALSRSQGVVLEGDELHIDMGKRAQGRLALAALHSVSLAQPEPPATPEILASPLPAPNLFLVFAKPQRITAMMGVQRTSKHVAVYVDEPQRLAAALRPWAKG